MLPLSDSAFCFVSIALQITGVASVAAARLWETSSLGMLWRGVCLVVLCLIGLTAATSLAWNSGCWQTCGITMAVMAIGATLDMRPSGHAESF